MATNVGIKISAELGNTLTNFKLVQAQSAALSRELTNLARQAQAAGGATPELTSRMIALSTRSLVAQNQMAALNATLKQGRTSALGFSQALGASRQAMGALGIAVSVGALFNFGREIQQSAADLDEQAQQVGVSAAGLQAYRAALQTSGITAAETDKLLSRLTRTMGEAQEGAGKQRDAFIALGISAKDLAGGPEAALPKIAKGLLAIKDPAERARLEADLFGRTGQKLESALTELAKSMAQIVKEQTALGQLLGEKLRKQADDNADGQVRAWNKVKNTIAPAAIEIGSAITWLTTKYADLLQASSDAGDAMGKALVGVKPASVAAAGGAQIGDRNGVLGVPASDAAHAALAQAKPKAKPDAGGGWKEDPADIAKREAQNRQIAQVKIQTTELAAQRQIQTEARTNTLLLDMGRESLGQWKAQADQLEDARNRAALKAVDARIQADAKDKVALARDYAEKELLAQQHKNNLIEIDQSYQVRLQQAAETAAQARADSARVLDDEIAAHNAEIVRSYEDAWAPITNGFNGMVQNLLQGNQTLVQTLARGAAQVADDFIMQKLRELEHAIITEEAKADAAWIGGQSRVEAELVASKEGSAVSVAAGSAQIMNDAYKAAAGAYSAVAGIPYVGPVLAPIAAAAAFTAVSAFSALTPFEVGTNYVPRTMPALLHQGERVIPRADNAALMAAVNGGVGGGERGGTRPVTIQLSAHDTQTGIQFILRNKSTIAKAVADVWNMNPSARPTY